MNIGIDIDDTISETYESAIIYAKEYTEKVLKRELVFNKEEISDPMWARHLFQWSEEEDKEFWNLYYEKIIQDVKPKEDAVKIIKKLSEKNNIIIITARSEDGGVITKITKEWLQENNIAYNKFFMGFIDKRAILKDNNIDIFIDDSYRTCQEAAELGIKVFLMNSKINENLSIDSNIERVFSWKEIYSKIEKIK